MSTEAELAFTLARRAVVRWRFDAERLRQLTCSWSPSKRRLAVMESELILDQIKSLTRRIQPLAKSGDLAVRREAQGTLVALDAVQDQLGSIAVGVSPETGALASAASRERRDVSQRQAARFEPRYIEYLTGRAPARMASSPAVVTTPTEDGAALAQTVLETAYRLWEQDGQPEGRADVYWRQALEMRWRERASEEANSIDDLQEHGGSAPALPGDGRQGYQEAVDAFTELAATLVSLCKELERPQASAPDGLPERPGGGDGAANPEMERYREEPVLKRGRYVKGQGVVWNGGGFAGSDDAEKAPGKAETPLHPRPKKLPPRPKKKGWGGA